MPDEPRRLPTISEGLKNSLGLLAAFKEAIEDTIADTLETGRAEPERARDTMAGALHRAQEAAAQSSAPLAVAAPASAPAPASPAANTPATEWVPRREFEALLGQVAELRARIAALEGRAAPPSHAIPAPGVPATAANDPPGTPSPDSPAGPAAS